MSQARVAVVVPAYNEERLIARTLRGIPDFVSHVVVVDDCSRDGTARAAEGVGDPRVEVVKHAVNGGVGRAIVTGYRAAFARGAEACVVMAGDAQMDPRDLEAVLGPVLQGQADYAKGDRLSHPGVMQRMPLTRWLGNRVLSLLTRLCTGLSVRDSQCGYTALSRRAAEKLPLDALWPRYGYPNDLLGLLSERGLVVRDVVVRPLYGDEQSGVGLRHALFVVPYVLMRVLWRRLSFSRASALPESVPDESWVEAGE
jgi:dolichol-phosphate mannosyltransferase